VALLSLNFGRVILLDFGACCSSLFGRLLPQSQND